MKHQEQLTHHILLRIFPYKNASVRRNIISLINTFTFDMPCFFEGWTSHLFFAFLISHAVAFRSTLCYFQGDRLTHSILITVFIWRSTCDLAINALYQNPFLNKGTVERKWLTHYSLMLLFYTPWKHLETFRFSDVFRGYRKATPGCNGLKLIYLI